MLPPLYISSQMQGSMKHSQDTGLVISHSCFPFFSTPGRRTPGRNIYVLNKDLIMYDLISYIKAYIWHLGEKEMAPTPVSLPVSCVCVLQPNSL